MPNNKSKAITLRVTEGELSALRQRAEEANLNVSQYILAKALGNQTNSTISEKDEMNKKYEEMMIEFSKLRSDVNELLNSKKK